MQVHRSFHSIERSKMRGEDVALKSDDNAVQNRQQQEDEHHSAARGRGSAGFYSLPSAQAAMPPADRRPNQMYVYARPSNPMPLSSSPGMLSASSLSAGVSLFGTGRSPTPQYYYRQHDPLPLRPSDGGHIRHDHYLEAFNSLSARAHRSDLLLREASTWAMMGPPLSSSTAAAVAAAARLGAGLLPRHHDSAGADDAERRPTLPVSMASDTEQAAAHRQRQEQVTSFSGESKKKRNFEEEDDDETKRATKNHKSQDEKEGSPAPDRQLSEHTKDDDGDFGEDGGEGGRSSASSVRDTIQPQRDHHAPHTDCYQPHDSSNARPDIVDGPAINHSYRQQELLLNNAIREHERARIAASLGYSHHNLHPPEDAVSTALAQQQERQFLYHHQSRMLLHRALQDEGRPLLYNPSGAAGAFLGLHSQTMGLSVGTSIAARTASLLDEEERLLAARGIRVPGRAARSLSASEKRTRDLAAAFSQSSKSGAFNTTDRIAQIAEHQQQDAFLQQEPRCRLLGVEIDEKNLSRYQVEVRKQIQVFEASVKEARTNAQGRNRPILPGQVGIRCRHCANLLPSQRKTGAVYYPNKLDGVYQTAQKMTVGHLFNHCQMIPIDLRVQLKLLKDMSKSSDGGGKRYWGEALESLGILESPSGGLIWSRSSASTLARIS